MDSCHTLPGWVLRSYKKQALELSQTNVQQPETFLQGANDTREGFITEEHRQVGLDFSEEVQPRQSCPFRGDGHLEYFKERDTLSVRHSHGKSVARRGPHDGVHPLRRPELEQPLSCRSLL